MRVERVVEGGETGANGASQSVKTIVPGGGDTGGGGGAGGVGASVVDTECDGVGSGDDFSHAVRHRRQRSGMQAMDFMDVSGNS